MTIDPEVLLLPAFASEDYDGTAVGMESVGSGSADPDEAAEGATTAVDEVGLWLDHFDFTEQTAVTGLPGPLRYDPAADVALARTGIGKAAAATTVGALVATPAIDLRGAHVVSVGVAGAPPTVGTVGSVFVADSVVDWDLKHRVDGDVFPLAWRTHDYVWDLDDGLVERVAEAAREADLANPSPARTLRGRYGDDRAPAVGVGATVCGDEVWHGAAAASEVDALCRAYGVEGFVTTMMEDAGTAAALERAGLLDRYVSLRAVSNFDRAPEGGDPHESVAWLDFETGVENVFRAGRAVVGALTR